MEVLDRNILWSFMFLLAGAVGVSVNYPDPVCAVKGSTVNLPCTFTPLKSVRVNEREVLIEIIRVVWCRNHAICQGATPSVHDSNLTNNNPRYKYLGDKKGNCTLQITDVQKEDEGILRFRMEANNEKAHFAGQSGVKVTVSDQTPMTIESSSAQEFKKGDSVTLNCSLTTTCTFHQLKFTWFRDGHALSESGPTLQFAAPAAKDSGNYTCGMKNTSTLSPPYSLYVEAEEEVANGGHGYLYPIVAVVFGVLLLVFALILVFIKRKRAAAAADKGQPAMGGEVEQKPPDIIYSNVLQQEPSRAVEEVSYASVQFKHKNQARPAEEAEDAIIYSSVVS